MAAGIEVCPSPEFWYSVKDEALITQEAPAANQPSFQQLLAAAFIVQEHNDKLQASNDPDAAYTRTLAEIVETERLIQDPRVDFHTALELIAERTHTITRADAVALGLLENGKLVYRADTGDTAGQLNAPALITETLAAECFRSGKAMQSPETRSDTRIDRNLCRQLGVESLVAVPLRQEGKIAGVLELRAKRAHAFEAPDLRTCQLMSGLIGEVLTKKAKQGWKQALASSEEDAVRSVLDHIQPELDRFEERDEDFDRAVTSLTANAPQATQNVDLSELPPPSAAASIPPVSKPAAKDGFSETLCGRCGHAFAGDEAFCGVCGAMRGEDSPVVLNPKTPVWDSLWDMQVNELPSVHDAGEDSAPPYYSNQELDPEVEDTVSRLSDQPDIDEVANAQRRFSAYDWERADPLELQASAEIPERVPERKSLEAEPSELVFKRESALARVWREQRATLYLAAAFGVLVVVIVSWVLQPAPPAAAASPAAEPETASRPQLSMMDKMLVGLGLAEAPTVTVYKGDPDARVWVDVHTALYYCSGSEFFGKTKGGRYAKQRDAQLDQFQPAARKACN